MVADQHEFVASGVLVHNCVWAATELNMGTSALAYLSAISWMCSGCEMPNNLRATVCKSCGAQRSEAA